MPFLPNRGHANAFKDWKSEEIDDAQNIRNSILLCCERASFQNLSKEVWNKNHQLIVIGDGTTGAEFAATLQDFVNEELTKLCPDAVNEAGGHSPTMFDRKNTQFVEEKFNLSQMYLKTNFKVSDKDMTNPATEFGHPMKEVDDAQNIRNSILLCCERASFQNLSKEEWNKNLQVIGIGDGTTGVEFAATLQDFGNDELAKPYPDAINEAGDHSLTMFDRKSAHFAEEKFNLSQIHLKTNFKVSDKDITKTNSATEFGGHPMKAVDKSLQTPRYQNPLLPLLGRRRFSSKPDLKDDQEFSTEPVCTKGFHGPGPGDTTVFLQNVDKDIINLGNDLKIGLLKTEFERDVRPSLVCNCLLLPKTLDDHTAAYLHGPSHGMMNLEPLYLSSLDIMVRMKGLKEPQRKHLIDHIIKRRVLVAEDWNRSYGNIELLEYNFRESNTSFVRGECDASFELNKNQVGPGKIRGVAKISIIIWKENQLLWAEIFEGIPCSEVHAAEVLAALALLRKCEEMKFLNVEIWSDSRRACGALNGELTIEMDGLEKNLGKDEPDRELGSCLLLRTMLTKFSKIVTVLKPRELMFLADHLLRMDSYGDYEVKKAINSWSPVLRGSALFRISNNHWTSSTIKSFGSKRAKKESKGDIYSPESIFFWKVEKEKKFEELQKVVSFLSPISIQVVLDAFEKKPPLLQKQFHNMFVERCYAGTGNTKVFGNVVPNQQQRTLVIVWDACIPRAAYYLCDSCTIIMAEEDDVEHLRKKGINEINVETYLYFNRGEFKKGSLRKK